MDSVPLGDMSNVPLHLRTFAPSIKTSDRCIPGHTQELADATFTLRQRKNPAIETQMGRLRQAYQRPMERKWQFLKYREIGKVGGFCPFISDFDDYLRLIRVSIVRFVWTRAQVRLNFLIHRLKHCFLS